ncbi:DUF4350 domain-containing protein [Haladaptatus sp. DFWS20]|uniref:DUF4350 domain-containing protein n=1 Tax=Haladaptatus sp. DFWS20 TaxID=3403467 RepID=UPI003EB8B1AA
MKRLDSYSTPTILFAVFTAIVLGAVLVAASTSSATFGAYNAAWDGTSELRTVAEEAGAEPEIGHNTSAYSRVTPNETVAVILSPERNYTAAEHDRLRRFVERGGTLLVADDYGSRTDPMLAALGIDARLDGRPLRDTRYQYRSPAMPVARNVSNQSLVTNVSGLTFNHGTAVTPGNATVLVATSEYAYLDTNRNQRLDENESIGSSAVATVERVGNGRVVVVGDSSIVINTMLERPGNRAFVRGIFDGKRTVLLDYSHTTRLPPLALAVLVLRESAVLQFLIGLGAISLVFVWSQRPDVLTRLRASVGSHSPSEPPSMSGEAMASYLEKRHPDWEPERINRVVSSLNEKRGK